jgi:hypothetical protein
MEENEREGERKREGEIELEIWKSERNEVKGREINIKRDRGRKRAKMERVRGR